MINFDGFAIDNLVSEHSDMVDEFERLLYWVTDREGLSSKERYELDWGNTILLMASCGKTELLEKMGKDRGIEIQDESAHDKWTTLEKSWIDYSAAFMQDVVAELTEQFDNSVLSKMAQIFQSRFLLTELHDLEYFFSERDTIELFAIGSEKYFKNLGLKERYRALDDKIREYVIGEVVDTLRRENSLPVLNQLSIRYLPREFWWRHIEWE